MYLQPSRCSRPPLPLSLLFPPLFLISAPPLSFLFPHLWYLLSPPVRAPLLTVNSITTPPSVVLKVGMR